MSTPAPPAEIGTVVVALRTRLPRSEAWRWLLIGAIVGLMVAAIGALFEVRVGGAHVAAIATPIAAGLAVVAPLLMLLDRLPVPAWVGDAGVAIAGGRLGHPKLVVRFSDVEALERVVTPAGAVRGRRVHKTGYVITLIARSPGGRVLAWLRATCTFRPGGPTDADDPETFRHLPPTHAWWLVSAAEQAWRGSRAASRVSSPP